MAAAAAAAVMVVVSVCESRFDGRYSLSDLSPSVIVSRDTGARTGASRGCGCVTRRAHTDLTGGNVYTGQLSSSFSWHA